MRFDLEIRRGSFRLAATMASDARVSGLFGPSGSGKTTLLMAIAGLIKPVRGFIEIGGETLYDSNRGISLAPEKRRLGMVFQEGRLFPHLSVRENLLYSRTASRTTAERLSEITELLNLESLLTHRVHQLSGGETRLVAIGRALLAEPRLLILDEPLTGLDESRRRRVLAYLLRLKNSTSTTMLYVSHAHSDFLALVDDACLLKDGTIMAQEAPRDLLKDLPQSGDESLETTLQGIATRVQGDQVEAHCDGATLHLSIPGTRPGNLVYVSIDAEDVLIGTGSPPETSARNVLAGRVGETRMHGAKTLVRVDAGPSVWAEITKESRSRLSLEPGTEVYLLIKASALRGVVLPSYP